METMNKVKSGGFFRSSVDLMLSQISFALGGVFFWIIAGQRLSDSEKGFGVVFISISSLLIFLSSLGIFPTLIRHVPLSDEREKLIGTLFSFSAFLLLLLYGIVIFIVNPLFLKIDLFSRFVFIVVFFLMMLSLQISQNLDAVFIAVNRTKLVLIKNIFQNILRLVVLSLVLPAASFSLYAANGIAAFFVVSLVGVSYFRVRALKLYFIPRLLKLVAPFHLVNFLNVFLLFFPGVIFPILLMKFQSASEAGFFYIPWMCFSVWCLLLVSVLNVLMEKVLNGGILRESWWKAGLLCFFIAFLGFIVFGVFAESILLIFKIVSFVAVQVMRWLFVSIFFFLVNQMYLTHLNLKHDVKSFGLLSLWLLLVFFTATWILIPIQGAFGAAIAWLITNTAGVIYIGVRVVWFQFFKQVK